MNSNQQQPKHVAYILNEYDNITDKYKKAAEYISKTKSFLKDHNQSFIKGLMDQQKSMSSLTIIEKLVGFYLIESERINLKQLSIDLGYSYPALKKFKASIYNKLNIRVRKPVSTE